MRIGDHRKDGGLLLHPEASPVVQAFGRLAPVRLGLTVEFRHRSASALNRLLAHTMGIRDPYRRSHWRTFGASFYELHLPFETHYVDWALLMDELAERLQTVGGVALAFARDVVEET